jgi:hypothetical protein
MIPLTENNKTSFIWIPSGFKVNLDDSDLDAFYS